MNKKDRVVKGPEGRETKTTEQQKNGLIGIGVAKIRGKNPLSTALLTEYV